MALQWYTSWFDSPYYPLLYRHRNDAEAERFLGLLTRHLGLPAGGTVLDLACGSGRHSAVLERLGYAVTGVDLSGSSLERARRAAPASRFLQADMRELPFENEFQLVLNLFTSFGYFADPQDHRRVIDQVSRALQPHGWFVLDYFNSRHILQHLTPTEQRTEDGVEFFIRRYVENHCVVKEIRVIDRGQSHAFEERVQLFEPPELHQLLADAHLEVQEEWGGYDGQPFEGHSERLILLARKTSTEVKGKA